MGILFEKLLKTSNMERAFNKAKRKRTVGIDNIAGKDICDRSKYLENLCYKISASQYFPKPPFIISKLNYDNIKIITFHILSFEDQVVEFAIRNVLYDYWRALFELYPCSARRGKEEEVFINHIKEGYEEENNYIITDLKKFTESINIDLLYKDIYAHCEDADIIDLIDKCLFSYYGRMNGLPLGQILTTFLPNIYLLDIEKQLPTYYRYFDCFVFPFHYENPKEILCYFSDILTRRFLAMNDGKTKILISPKINQLISTVKGV